MFTVLHYPKDKERILARFEESNLDMESWEEKVKPLIEDVRKTGDRAVRKYTKKFDGADIENFRVSSEEMEEALNSVTPQLKAALETASRNVYLFHAQQMKKSKDFAMVKEEDYVISQRSIPVDAAGLYVPGGQAPYPSTVIMTAVPARIAGVKNIVLITPPGKDGKVHPAILAAAHICKVDTIYKVGGVQGIAALAFGTESIPKVDVIVGPGNAYVTAAKKYLYGRVNIDMVAGPSEIMILADEGAKPSYIAADMMSQAEHDELATSILVAFSQEKIEQVLEELQNQVQDMARKETVLTSLRNHGMGIVVENKEQAVELINLKAPEHCELMVADYQKYIKDIRHAGVLFLGYFTPEPVGDYYAGPNHTLPTSGTARYFSPLGTYTFQKKSNIVYYSPEYLKKHAPMIELLAESEGFIAHKNAVSIRKRDL